MHSPSRTTISMSKLKENVEKLMQQNYHLDSTSSKSKKNQLRSQQLAKNKNISKLELLVMYKVVIVTASYEL
jgi:septation ring formation regulator EzrA